MKIQGYRERVIDAKILAYLRIFGAVCVEDPKWCGKTWTCHRQAESEFLVGDPAGDFQNRRLVQIEPIAKPPAYRLFNHGTHGIHGKIVCFAPLLFCVFRVFRGFEITSN
ncbi:MAG: hypothetical protein IJR99_00075 [Kiritimatiellae bacterium]|nr:hypothetical protein [Kiritimatiellia bacterium]